MKIIHPFYLYLRQIWDLLGDEKKGIPVLFILFISATFVELLGLSIIVPFIGMLVNPEETINLFLIDWLLYIGVPLEQNIIILSLGTLLIILFFLKGVLSIGISGAIAYFKGRQHLLLSVRMMKSYQSMPFAAYLLRNSSEYVHAITSYTHAFSLTIASILQLISDSLILISILILLAFTDWTALLLLFGILLLFFLFYNRFVKSYLYELGRGFSLNGEQIIKTINEALIGLKENRILRTEDFFLFRMKKFIEANMNINIKVTMLQLAPHSILEFLVISFVVLLTIVTISMGEDTPSLLPILGVFGVAGIRLVTTANKVVNSLSQIKHRQFPTQRLWEDINYLNRFEQEQNPANDSILLPMAPSFRSLTLENISFRYKSAKDFALKQINLTINKGDSIGIIGKSGAGKTTLLDVLLGLLKPKSGTISLNSEQLNGRNWEKWRTQVAYIPQEIYLIDDSLKKNIALGIKDEDISEERLRNAIRQALLEELIQQLPQNFDTVIGERGIRLSGGQRQRVALARAFYFQRNILIMDEATAALDNETENEIIDEIRGLKGKVTLIIIAHRLTTIQYCQKIYRLERGEIVAEGSFDEVVGRSNI